MKIYEIPGTLIVEWDDEVKTTFDTWSSYSITVPEFREAILNKGLSNARAHGGRAWVMDATKAKGVFTPEIQKLIELRFSKPSRQPASSISSPSSRLSQR